MICQFDKNLESQNLLYIFVKIIKVNIYIVDNKNEKECPTKQLNTNKGVLGMGQQQLLLIVLGVIIVGVAIAVGVTQFKSSAIDANRQAIISDIVNFSAKAQRFYRTPTTLAGGGQDFLNFGLSAVDTSNANGSYSLTTTPPSGATPVAGSVTPIPSSATTIYVVGCGKETGNDGSNPVKVYSTVTPDNIATNILN